jgi:hypothetical protein
MKYEWYEIYPGRIIKIHFVPKHSNYLVIGKYKGKKVYRDGVYTMGAKVAFVRNDLEGEELVETIRHELLHAFDAWKDLRMTEKQVAALEKLNIAFPKVRGGNK